MAKGPAVRSVWREISGRPALNTRLGVIGAYRWRRMLSNIRLWKRNNEYTDKHRTLAQRVVSARYSNDLANRSFLEATAELQCSLVTIRNTLLNVETKIASTHLSAIPYNAMNDRQDKSREIQKSRISNPRRGAVTRVPRQPIRKIVQMLRQDLSRQHTLRRSIPPDNIQLESVNPNIYIDPSSLPIPLQRTYLNDWLSPEGTPSKGLSISSIPPPQPVDIHLDKYCPDIEELVRGEGSREPSPEDSRSVPRVFSRSLFPSLAPSPPYNNYQSQDPPA